MLGAAEQRRCADVYKCLPIGDAPLVGLRADHNGVGIGLALALWPALRRLGAPGWNIGVAAPVSAPAPVCAGGLLRSGE